nr:WAT1-related protein At4g01440 isoform X2 [Aegilops tauschii subsp. strangulata]
MLAFDLISAVMTALVKKALEQGLNRLVLVTLRQLVATIFSAPIAFFKERSTRPKLTLEVLAYLFFSTVFGAALSQYTFYGRQYTTATFTITFINLSPVLTFLIAVVMRMEPLKVNSMAGAAKITRTLTSLAGLLPLSLYKGVPLTHQAATAPSPGCPAAHHASPSDSSGNRSWMLGTMALLFNCPCFSFWLLLQTKLTKYLTIYSSTAIMFFSICHRHSTEQMSTRMRGYVSNMAGFVPHAGVHQCNGVEAVHISYFYCYKFE